MIWAIKYRLIVLKQPLRNGNLNHALAVFVKLIYKTWSTCRDGGKTKWVWVNHLGIVDKILFYSGKSLDGLIDFYFPWNQRDRELHDLLGFRFMVGPNFDDNPLLEPTFLLVFFVQFSVIQKKYSGLGHTWF